MALIDIQMPVMNGPELAAAIGEDEKSTGAHQPLIAMTAHVMTGKNAWPRECMATLPSLSERLTSSTRLEISSLTPCGLPTLL